MLSTSLASPPILPFKQAYDPCFQGMIKAQPEDFVVTEIEKVHPSGQGEHIWLKIQKRDANTTWVAAQLARIAGVKKRDIGFAGLKDRQAVSTQWFSIYLPKGDVPLSVWEDKLPTEVKVITQTRHDRKLRRGTLKGNHFCITLRECVFDYAELMQAVENVRTQGMPNYFGQQRFGYDYHNIEKAKQLFSGELRGKAKARHQHSIYVSAARSWLFNHILSTRIAQGTWNMAIAGDVFMLQGTRSYFSAEIDAAVQQRMATNEIHPTATLWGKGALASRLDMLQIEREIAAAEPLLCQGLEDLGLKQERRAMRVMVKDLACDILDQQTLQFTFSLPAGCYATVLLSQLGGINHKKSL